MSKKVTFEELLDAISEQSNKPQQFTHDFVKDWVSIINEGLRKDGNINIAGLGKFELRKMDEQDGFNPQTEEQITIPAHNKIVFKPYKDLRELVNAPYAHLEPEIIDEDGDEEQSSEISDDQQSEDQTSGGLATSSDHDQEEESSVKEKTPWEEETGKKEDKIDDDPFSFDSGSKSTFPLSMDDDLKGKDEKDPDSGDTDSVANESEEKESINESLTEKESGDSGLVDESIEKQHDSSEAEEAKVSEETAAGSHNSVQDKKHTQEKHTSTGTPSFRDRRHRKRVSEGNFWIIAGAFLIILLLIIGAWYYVGSQQAPSASDTVATTQPNNGGTDNQSNSDDPDSPQNSDQTTNSTQPSSNQPSSGSSQQAGNAQAASPSVKTISVVKGQTLWGLADNQYDNPYLWPWIYDTNKSSIDDPDIIVIGQPIDIPLRSGSDDQLSENDSLQVALGYVETYKWYEENNLTNAKFYLYAAKKYHARVFEYTDTEIDEADLAFANRAQ